MSFVAVLCPLLGRRLEPDCMWEGVVKSDIHSSGRGSSGFCSVIREPCIPSRPCCVLLGGLNSYQRHWASLDSHSKVSE